MMGDSRIFYHFNVKKVIKQASEIKCFQQLELQMNGWNLYIYTMVYNDAMAHKETPCCI